MKTLFRATIAVILTLTLATCATAQTATGTTAETRERYPLTTAMDFAAALYLRDNITLTVNGTVSAPSNRIGFDTGSGARMMNINGNGTIYLTGKGLLFFIGEGKKLTLDGVTLVGLPYNDRQLVEVGEGAELVMVSGAIYGASAEGGNANNAPVNAAIMVYRAATSARWGTGGTYTRGGVPQTGGGNIASTNDTLIAIPAR